MLESDVLVNLISMASYFQRSFAGGMDMVSNDTDIQPNAYRYGVNIRQRYGYLQTIKKSLDITYNLKGLKFQGLYAAGNVWICFMSGRAYYMPLGGTTWYQVPFLSLDQDVEYIYVAAVPGSTNNYLRSAVTTTNTNSAGASTTSINANAGIIQTPFFVSGTPAGLVCQDGINQPWLITYDAVNSNATARVLGNYTQWDNTGTSANTQEYVPIGSKMMYLNGVLYIVSKAGNTIYRSVSGAPLNFMVNIDTNGDKLATEALGGADTVSFAIDFDPINALFPSTTEANTFIIGTSRNIYGMQPDTTVTIFGEPTFDKAFQLVAGIVNQFSFADNNGDTVFTDFRGVKSFNAVQSVKFAGRNDPFSKNISGAINEIIQSVTACYSFDNYVRFSLLTIYGYCNAIYDNINKVWVGFDFSDASTRGIKMFAQADNVDESFLAAGTQDGHIYLMEQSEDNEVGILQMRAFVSGTYGNYGFVQDSLEDEIKMERAKVFVTDNLEDGVMYVQEVVDDERGQIWKQNIQGVMSPMKFPLQFPITFNGSPRGQNLEFSMLDGVAGYKTSPIVSWNSDCQVEQVEILLKSSVAIQSQKQQVRIFNNTLSPS